MKVPDDLLVKRERPLPFILQFLTKNAAKAQTGGAPTQTETSPDGNGPTKTDTVEDEDVDKLFDE